MRASQEIFIQSRAGSIEATSLNDLKLHSVAGSVSPFRTKTITIIFFFTPYRFLSPTDPPRCTNYQFAKSQNCATTLAELLVARLKQQPTSVPVVCVRQREALHRLTN